MKIKRPPTPLAVRTQKIETLSDPIYPFKKSAGWSNENWLALDKRNCGAWRIATFYSYKNSKKFTSWGSRFFTIKLAIPSLASDNRPNTNLLIINIYWAPGPAFASSGMVVSCILWTDIKIALFTNFSHANLLKLFSLLNRYISTFSEDLWLNGWVQEDLI